MQYNPLFSYVESKSFKYLFLLVCNTESEFAIHVFVVCALRDLCDPGQQNQS